MWPVHSLTGFRFFFASRKQQMLSPSTGFWGILVFFFVGMFQHQGDFVFVHIHILLTHRFFYKACAWYVFCSFKSGLFFLSSLLPHYASTLRKNCLSFCPPPLCLPESPLPFSTFLHFLLSLFYFWICLCMCSFFRMQTKVEGTFHCHLFALLYWFFLLN